MLWQPLPMTRADRRASSWMAKAMRSGGWNCYLA